MPVETVAKKISAFHFSLVSSLIYIEKYQHY